MMTNRILAGVAEALVVMAVWGTADVRAVSEAWSASAVDGAWENGLNWASGNVPGSTVDTTNQDVATFSSASPITVVMPDANRNIRSLVFTNVAAAAYTIGATTGNTLRLSSGGLIQMAAAISNSMTINAPLEIEGDGGSYAFTNNAGSTRKLNFFGAISGVATTGNVTELSLTGTNVSAGLIASSLSDGPNGGRLALRKTGTGMWTLLGSSTYSGGTILDSGGLTLGTNGGNLGVFGTGPVTINGGILYPSGGNPSTITLTNNTPFIWNGDVTVIGQGNRTIVLGTNTVTMNTNMAVILDSYIVLNVGGSIVGTGRTLSVRAGAASSTLNLKGSNIVDGGVNLYSGYLGLGNSYALGTNALSVYGGGFSQTAGPLKGICGETWYSNFNLSGSVDLGTAPITLIGARRIPSADNGTFTIGGNISGTNASLTVQGSAYSGTFRLMGSNSFDGGFAYANGSNATLTVCIDNPYALGTGPFTINPYAGNGSGVVQINNDTTGAITVATANVQNWNTRFTFAGTRSLNLGTGPVVLGTNAMTVTVSGTNILTVGGPIGDNSKGYPLTKAGTATLVLTGASTYTGLTTVAAGKLSMAGGGSLAGSVRVMTNATLELLTSSGIADKATLQVDSAVVGSNTLYGVVSLTNGVVEVVSVLTVGGTNYGAGTYGSTNSEALNKFVGYFAGVGVLKVVPTGGMIFQVR